MTIPVIPKRLIICCDGTWQSSVSGRRNIPSNVTRIARSIAPAGQDADGKVWQQIVYYDSGVGTGSLSFLEQARQGGTGDGLIVNMIEAYNFLVNNYQPGDQIFCFGFSRGAYTARAIAGLVTDIGILKPENMQHFAPLFSIYRRNIMENNFRMTKDYLEFVHGVRPMVPEDQLDVPYEKKPFELEHGHLNYGEESHVIEVVGVFDTVGSLGVADAREVNTEWTRLEYEFLNVNLSPYIKHAFHALALDDHRQPFLPTLFYIPNDETIFGEREALAKEEAGYPELKKWRDELFVLAARQRAANPPDLLQVWFSGVHINVGGGADDNGTDYEGLANVCFAWLIQQIRPYLTFHPWLFTYEPGGIAGYYQHVIDEEWQYGKIRNPSLKHSIEDYGHAVAQRGRKKLDAVREHLLLGPKKAPKLVPAVNFKFGSFPATMAHRWGTSEHQDSYTAMYQVLNDPVNRTPGECWETVTGLFSKKSALRDLGQTNEYIHPSVFWREKNSDHYTDLKWKYKSLSLQGFRREQDADGKWGYRKIGSGLWLPEWHVEPVEEPADNAEWLVVDSCADREETKAHLIRTHLDWVKADEVQKLKVNKPETVAPSTRPMSLEGLSLQTTMVGNIEVIKLVDPVRKAA